MNSDRVMYILYSIIVLILIFCSSIFGNYSLTITENPTLKLYISWFVSLVILNLFNMLIIFIYFFFKKGIIGKKGLKGEQGDMGEPGKDGSLPSKEN